MESNYFSNIVKESTSPLPTIVDSIGFIDYRVLEESKKPGSPMVVEWEFKACIKNDNNRIYKPEIWIRNLSDPEVINRMRSRGMYGELEHPNDGLTNLSRVSHIILDAKFIESKETIYVKAEILDTPKGKLLQELFAKKCRVGASSRGRGTANSHNGVDIVNEDYKLETFDMVYNPSAKDAIVHRADEQNESVPYRRRKIIGEKNVPNVMEIKERVNEILRLYPESNNATREKYKNELLDLQLDLGKVLKENPEVSLVAEEINENIKEAKDYLEACTRKKKSSKKTGKKKPKRKGKKSMSEDNDEEADYMDDEFDNEFEEDEFDNDFEEADDDEYLSVEEDEFDNEFEESDDEDEFEEADDDEYLSVEEDEFDNEFEEDGDIPSVAEKPLLDRGDISEENEELDMEEEDALIPPKKNSSEYPFIMDDEFDNEFEEADDDEYLSVEEDEFDNEFEEADDDEYLSVEEDEFDNEFEEADDDEYLSVEEDEFDNEFEEDGEEVFPVASDYKAQVEAMRRVNNLLESEEVNPEDIAEEDEFEFEEDDEEFDYMDDEEYVDEHSGNQYTEGYRAEFKCLNCGNMIESKHTYNAIQNNPVRKTCSSCGSPMMLESLTRHNACGYLVCECGKKMKYLTESSSYKCRCGREASALDSLSKGDLLLRYNEAIKLVNTAYKSMRENKQIARSYRRKLTAALEALSESIQRTESLKMKQILENEIRREPVLKIVEENLVSSTSVNDLLERVAIAKKAVDKKRKKAKKSSKKRGRPRKNESGFYPSNLRESREEFPIDITQKILENKNWE